MRYLLGLFANGELANEYQEKIKQIQSLGKTPSDFEFDYNGKRIKLYLPNDVRDQYKLLMLAESFILKDNLNNEDKLLDLRFKLLDAAIKRMLVDGSTSFDLNSFDVDIIDTIVMTFISELLLPLYLRSSNKIEERFKQNLKKSTIV